MAEEVSYKCVTCGKKAAALYRMYGPSVLKLNKCKYCKGTVDKYIEFDIVIVIIDLILISKEAQRHVIFNTEFKSYWKIFLVCALLETYGVWHNDSLLNIGINSLCGIKTNATINSTYLEIPINKSLPSWWKQQCLGWVHSEQGDRYIWEQDFYIHLCSTLLGIAMFIITVNVMVRLLKPLQPRHWRERTTEHKVFLIVRATFDRKTLINAPFILFLIWLLSAELVPFITMLKAFSMAYASTLFTLPMMVWGNADTSVGVRATHYLLGHAYSFAVFFSAFSVLYKESPSLTLVTLKEAFVAKYLTMFVATPMLRRLVG